ncbi:BamA/TamA family outer membrane protein [Candidatus Nitrospira allomarina]|uniref:BamA/TamA family outer membrane protein n=1 Tax=Candidatus Nitrospira allomarina TaxID=3020900 RepID=A0AA96K056_9BACT|nr:BamA/TamA family outer membrane protein [Candidatus Nitrospira allomarina]WNM59354.1 BamA/TamA family outer membrane protein [Candidatus Nitrospira allomarina]
MISFRSWGLVLVCLALGGVILQSSKVLAENSFFVVPAFSTSKNDGQDFGLIAPSLNSDAEGNLRSLFAPMLIHNSFLGVRGTLNYFHYWSGGRQMETVGSYTEEIERKLKFRYQDPGFIEGLFFVDVGAQFFKNATKRFYGLGQTTPKSNESNYTGREIHIHWNFGIHLNDVTRLSVNQRFRNVEIQPGGVDDEPYTKDRFPRDPGIKGATILAHRLVFQYDSRDNLNTPTAGTRVEAFGELAQNFDFGKEEDLLYFRSGFDIRHLIPSPSKRYIFVARAMLQLSFGDGIPFYEQSSLGGEDNLRGYGKDRFIDKHMVAFNVEERIHLFGMKMFNVSIECELTPFVDMGRTYKDFKFRQFHDWEVTPGVGFRAIVRPNVMARVDWGYSREGGAVFAGLNYPF